MLKKICVPVLKGLIGIPCGRQGSDDGSGGVVTL